MDENRDETESPNYETPKCLTVVKIEALSESENNNSGSGSEHSNYDEKRGKRQKTHSKKKRQAIKWNFVKEFANSAEANNGIKEENTWSTDYSHTNDKGYKKRYYRCNKVKKTGPQCMAKILLVFVSTSESVLMYRRNAEHNHDQLNNTSTQGINENVKLEINRLMELNMKPRGIMNALGKISNLQLPTINQLKNYISEQRRRADSETVKHIISLTEVETWLSEHSAIPEFLHQAFVISYEVMKDMRAPGFRFVISTKYMLGIARHAEVIHADAINRMTWQGYPLYVIGTTDKDIKFNALCLVVATNDDKGDYKLAFQALKKKVEDIYASTMQPKVFVCDEAKHVQDAFKDVFGDGIPMRLCWNRIRRNIMYHALRKMNNKVVEKDLLTDLEALHSVTCSNVFESAAKCFLEKYQDLTSFVEYFTQHCLNQNKSWYLGAAPNSPPTNNCLKTFMKGVKDSNILRERFPVSQFAVVVPELVGEWSKKYFISHTKVEFAKSPIITIKDWTVACQWAKSQKDVVELYRDETYIHYKIPADESSNIRDFYEPWGDFDEFKEQYFSSWEVALPLIRDDWRAGYCNCPKFYTEYMCEHLIGLAVRYNHAMPPIEVKNLPNETEPSTGKKKRCRAKIVS